MFMAHDPNRQQLTRSKIDDQFSFTTKNNHLKSQHNYCILVDTSLDAECKDRRHVVVFLKYDGILFSHNWRLSRRMFTS